MGDDDYIYAMPIDLALSLWSGAVLYARRSWRRIKQGGGPGGAGDTCRRREAPKSPHPRAETATRA